jgi:PhzF family phenazine biosynthesis protein
MKIDYLHVSAFTRVPGGGNPAAVCELEGWPSEEQLSRIGQKIGLPVTSCLVRSSHGLELRWISKSGSPVQSVCGHGTLAAAYAVSLQDPTSPNFTFLTPGGEVPVRREGDIFHLSLPRWDSKPIAEWPELVDALGTRPAQIRDAGRDVLAVFGAEEEVRALRPDIAKLLALGRRGFIATAQGRDHDCVSRFFCPAFGIGVDEDPVTGSAHCSIAPYWSERLRRKRILAFQASAAGGELICEVTPHAVTIGASAALLGKSSVSL